jgi:hypothetical protein
MVIHLPSGMVPALPGHTSPCTALPGHTKPCQPRQAPPSLATPDVPRAERGKLILLGGFQLQTIIHPYSQSLEGRRVALLALSLEGFHTGLEISYPSWFASSLSIKFGGAATAARGPLERSRGQDPAKQGQIGNPQISVPLHA